LGPILGVDEDVILYIVGSMNVRTRWAAEMVTHVVDVSMRYGKGVKIEKAFSDAKHLEVRPVVVRRLRSTSRKKDLTRR
jgi:hypothetical protein